MTALDDGIEELVLEQFESLGHRTETVLIFLVKIIVVFSHVIACHGAIVLELFGAELRIVMHPIMLGATMFDAIKDSSMLKRGHIPRNNNLFSGDGT